MAISYRCLLIGQEDLEKFVTVAAEKFIECLKIRPEYQPAMIGWSELLYFKSLRNPKTTQPERDEYEYHLLLMALSNLKTVEKYNPENVEMLLLFAKVYEKLCGNSKVKQSEDFFGIALFYINCALHLKPGDIELLIRKAKQLFNEAKRLASAPTRKIENIQKIIAVGQNIIEQAQTKIKELQKRLNGHFNIDTQRKNDNKKNLSLETTPKNEKNNNENSNNINNGGVNNKEDKSSTNSETVPSNLNELLATTIELEHLFLNLMAMLAEGAEVKQQCLLLSDLKFNNFLSQYGVKDPKGFNQRKKVVLTIGNTYGLEISHRHTPHKWIMFVKVEGCDGDERLYIENVEFTLHYTFKPSQVIISKPPFQISRFGWGTFTIGIEVRFTKYFGNVTRYFEHPLIFEIGGSLKKYIVELRK